MPRFTGRTYRKFPSLIKKLANMRPGFGRTSLRPPGRKRPAGSVTIEAALAVPLFFFAVLALFYMLEVMSIRTSIRSGMQYAARRAAEEARLKPLVMVSTLEDDVVEAVGSNRLERSIVVDGSEGISCEGSWMSPLTGIIRIRVTYQVLLPVPVFRPVPVNMEETMRMKGWTGYAGSGFGEGDEETVYVTETGRVYHKDYHCSYLDLSIRVVSAGSLETLRNESQGRYHACEYCVHGGAAGRVFVTNYGDRYHNSINCSGLKRTIYAIPLSEAAGKGACSKCSR